MVGCVSGTTTKIYYVQEEKRFVDGYRNDRLKDKGPAGKSSRGGKIKKRRSTYQRKIKITARKGQVFLQ